MILSCAVHCNESVVNKAQIFLSFRNNLWSFGVLANISMALLFFLRAVIFLSLVIEHLIINIGHYRWFLKDPLIFISGRLGWFELLLVAEADEIHLWRFYLRQPPKKL